MKTLKKDVRSRIVTATRSESAKYGYRKTPMWATSAKSGVVLGDIYNYLKTKDDILYVVLHPLFSAIDERTVSYSKDEYGEVHPDFSSQRQKDFLKGMFCFIFLYKGELGLLLFGSQGTSLENSRENLIDVQVAISKTHME